MNSNNKKTLKLPISFVDSVKLDQIHAFKIKWITNICFVWWSKVHLDRILPVYIVFHVFAYNHKRKQGKRFVCNSQISECFVFLKCSHPHYKEDGLVILGLVFELVTCTQLQLHKAKKTSNCCNFDHKWDFNLAHFLRNESL